MQRYLQIFDNEIAAGAEQFGASKGGAHLETVEAGGFGRTFAGIQQKSPDAATSPVWVDEEGADLGRIATRVKEVVVAVGPLVSTVEGFTLAPPATGDDGRLSLRFSRAILDNQVGAVCDELGIDTEDGGQGPFQLRGCVVQGLQASDGRVDERTKDRKICELSGTDAEIGIHLKAMEIVAAKTAAEFGIYKPSGSMMRALE